MTKEEIIKKIIEAQSNNKAFIEVAKEEDLKKLTKQELAFILYVSENAK